MARRSTPRAVRSKSSFYPDEVLDRIIEAGGGLPDDDREVEVLAQIDSGGEKLYKRATPREALRACLEGAAEQYTRSVKSAAVPTPAMLAKRYAEIEKAAQRFLRVLAKPAKAVSKRERITRILHSELGLELAGGVPSLEALSGVRVQEMIRHLEELLRCATRLRQKSASMEQIARTKKDVALNELIRWPVTVSDDQGRTVRGAQRRGTPQTHTRPSPQLPGDGQIEEAFELNGHLDLT